ncbi:hypothetical protein MRX96_052699, partial [Rhipicephalus microplus]
FHTDLSRLVFTNRFLQLSTLLPSDVLYGLGQHWGPPPQEPQLDQPDPLQQGQAGHGKCSRFTAVSARKL